MPTPPDAPYKMKQHGFSATDIAVAAAASAKLAGCTCEPTIRIREVGNKIFTADVAHDDWCAHPSQRMT